MGIGVPTIVFLFVGATATAAVSAVAGIGGGLVLFALMASVLEYAVLIPMYGTVQFTSAASRVWLFRKEIIYPLFWAFLIPFVPAAALSALLWFYLIEIEAAQPYIKMGIALYLFLFVGFEKLRFKSGDPKWLMAAAGFVSGLFSIVIGAVGTVQAPFFAALKLRKEEFVALFAIASFLANGVKIPLFIVILDRLSFAHGVLIALLAISSFLGALTGRKILGAISEESFRRVFNAVLFAIACKLFFWDGVRALFAAN